MSIATAETRLEEYAQTLNLTQDLLYGEGSLNGSTTGGEISGGEGDQSGDMTYYALSLREDGSPIEVSLRANILLCYSEVDVDAEAAFIDSQLGSRVHSVL